MSRLENFKTLPCYIYIYTFQFYITRGKYYEYSFSCGVDGMYDKYVLAWILYHYGMLET